MVLIKLDFHKPYLALRRKKVKILLIKCKVKTEKKCIAFILKARSPFDSCVW